MIIRYTFVTGEVSEVEVTDESLCETLVEVGDQDKKTNRKESRRHTLMSVAEQEDGMQFRDETVDIEAMVQAIDASERLRRAMAKLSSDQRALIRSVYIERRSIVSIAREAHVDESAIRDRLRRVHDKLCKLLS